MDKNLSESIVNEEVMMERGKFRANGYTFVVKPVYLGEEDQYFSEMAVPPIPVSDNGNSIQEKNDKELSKWIISLFSDSVNGKRKNKNIFKRIFFFFTRKRDYTYYSDVPSIQPIIKWLEKKVTYNGKKVYFYDLERKYGLSKSEIERLIIYFHELSGF